MHIQVIKYAFWFSLMAYLGSAIGQFLPAGSLVSANGLVPKDIKQDIPLTIIVGLIHLGMYIGIRHLQSFNNKGVQNIANDI